MPEPTFTDAGEDVVVEVPIESGIAAEDVHISGGADALAIRTGEAGPPLLSVLQLYSTVAPAETRVEVPGDDTLRVTLRKLDPGMPWPSLHAQEAPQVTVSPVCATYAVLAASSTHTSLSGCYVKSCEKHEDCLRVMS